MQNFFQEKIRCYITVRKVLLQIIDVSILFTSSLQTKFLFLTIDFLFMNRNKRKRNAIKYSQVIRPEMIIIFIQNKNIVYSIWIFISFIGSPGILLKM